MKKPYLGCTPSRSVDSADREMPEAKYYAENHKERLLILLKHTLLAGKNNKEINLYDR